MTDQVTENVDDVRRRVLGAVETGAEDTVSLLQEMLRVPSVNPWFEDDEGHYREQNFQEYMSSLLTTMGADSLDVWEPSADELSHRSDGPGYYPGRDFTQRPNLVARFSGQAPTGQTVMIQGHADVVAVGQNWTREPFGGELIDGKVYGRGAVDMKGGIAAAVGAIAAIRAAGVSLKEDLLFASVADEEAGGMGTLALVDRGYRAPGGAIIPEPTGLTIAPLCRGILWGRVTIVGKAGHIELDQPHWKEGGAVDAIEYGRQLLNSIHELNREWARNPRKNHKYLRIPCQVNVAQVEAGEYPTTFADKCVITFDAQYLPSEKDANGLGSQVKAELEEFFSKFAEDDEWIQQNPPRVEWLVDADCGETPVEAAVVQACVNAAQAVGLPGTIQGAPAHADMGLLIDSGTPTINFGPGSLSMAHQADECLSVDELKQATKVIALTLLDLCGIAKE